MKILGLLLPRILGTIILIMTFTYGGWWFWAQYSSRPVFDLCLLGIVVTFASSYLFWGTFSNSQTDPIFILTTQDLNKEEILHQIETILRNYKFSVRRIQELDKVEATGNWWVFTEHFYVIADQQKNEKIQIRAHYSIGHVSSFHTQPMIPFFPSIFFTIRTIILRSRIQDALKSNFPM